MNEIIFYSSYLIPWYDVSATHSIKNRMHIPTDKYSFLSLINCYYSIFYRASWFVVYSVMVSIVSLIGTIIMNFIVLDNRSAGTFFLLFVLILEFGLSMIMFAFIMTTLFSKVFQSMCVLLCPHLRFGNC